MNESNILIVMYIRSLLIQTGSTTLTIIKERIFRTAEKTRYAPPYRIPIPNVIHKYTTNRGVPVFPIWIMATANSMLSIKFVTTRNHTLLLFDLGYWLRLYAYKYSITAIKTNTVNSKKCSDISNPLLIYSCTIEYKNIAATNPRRIRD